MEKKFCGQRGLENVLASVFLQTRISGQHLDLPQASQTSQSQLYPPLAYQALLLLWKANTIPSITEVLKLRALLGLLSFPHPSNPNLASETDSPLSYVTLGTFLTSLCLSFPACKTDKVTARHS